MRSVQAITYVGQKCELRITCIHLSKIIAFKHMFSGPSIKNTFNDEQVILIKYDIDK